jgi:hypothetical protein
MYVVIEMFNRVGVMSRTSVKTFSAGKNVVAPKGDIKADSDTRNIIQIFAPCPQIEYSGPDICLCSSSGRALISASTSFEKSTGPAASSRDTVEPAFVRPMLDHSVARSHRFEKVTGSSSRGI